MKNFLKQRYENYLRQRESNSQA